MPLERMLQALVKYASTTTSSTSTVSSSQLSSRDTTVRSNTHLLSCSIDTSYSYARAFRVTKNIPPNGNLPPQPRLKKYPQTPTFTVTTIYSTFSPPTPAINPSLRQSRDLNYA
ncbi:hypothetical protein M407DRAFT_33906 [Tulasnella calospora MUT 4182]|uniref:Uncharacterized protein n=1 Tax=Tulasnella calospora MUT 4182 TaxID=1051891 RepID=A0A0C3PPM0_9AGAM|nr:hypothetical protein M407DRAFT_33906 [Tulasnella calospora MUT 4182]